MRQLRRGDDTVRSAQYIFGHLRFTEQQASQTATSWLASNRPGESVMSVDAYPGYFTIDTAKAGKVVGMLSVNATTGAVWYHTWHGTFVAMEDK